jgi:hypothetical protein
VMRMNERVAERGGESAGVQQKRVELGEGGDGEGSDGANSKSTMDIPLREGQDGHEAEKETECRCPDE